MSKIALALILVLGLIGPMGSVAPARAAPARVATVIIQLEGGDDGATVGGWAVDVAAPDDTGIDGVDIYLDGDMNSGTYLGQASYGTERPDVAALLGNAAYANSGFALSVDDPALVSGDHTIVVVAHSRVSGDALAAIPSASETAAMVTDPTSGGVVDNEQIDGPSGDESAAAPPEDGTTAGDGPDLAPERGPYVPPYTFVYPARSNTDPNGLPIIGTAPGGYPWASAPGIISAASPIQVAPTLSDVTFLTGQSYYNTLPNYNGYLYPGLTLPSGSQVAAGSFLRNGQLYYAGTATPVTQYLAAPSTGYPIYGARYTANAIYPGGTVVPYNAGYNYWSGYNWGTLATAPAYQYQPAAAYQYRPVPAYQYQTVPTYPYQTAPTYPYQTAPAYQYQTAPAYQAPTTPTLQLTSVTYQPYGNGYRLGVVLPTQPPAAGYAYPTNWSTTAGLAGNAAVQSTLTARVTTANGLPVAGAQVSYNGYQLPATDANGLTTGTVMLPVNPNQTLTGNVIASYGNYTGAVPLYVTYR